MAKSKYQVMKGQQEEALSHGKTPPWNSLSTNQKDRLIQAIIAAIAEWRPVERRLLDPLPQGLLNRLLEAIRQIRAQGLAGPQFRASDRLKILKQQLSRRGMLPKDKEPTPDQVLEQQPKPLQRQVKAQEAMLVKQAERKAEQAMVQMLSRTL